MGTGSTGNTGRDGDIDPVIAAACKRPHGVAVAPNL
jgi:hypothetical protein